MGNFEDKMSRAAAKTLMLYLESLQSTHFKTNTLPDNLITLMSKLNLTEQKSLVLRAQHYVVININPSALDSSRIASVGCQCFSTTRVSHRTLETPIIDVSVNWLCSRVNNARVL